MGLLAVIYTNTTTEITGTVNGSPVTGAPATDNLEVLFAPILKKEFTDDPVMAGETVDLEFRISLDELASSDATGITFTDDLEATLTGLAPSGACPCRLTPAVLAPC